MVGPLIAGVLVSLDNGFAYAYGIDAVLFTAALYSALRLPPIPPTGTGQKLGLRSVVEGLRFIATRPVLFMSFLVDICAMVLRHAARAVPGGGRRSVRRSGRPAVRRASRSVRCWPGCRAGGSAGSDGRARRWCSRSSRWGAAVAVSGLAHQLWLVVVLLALAGAADLVSAVYRQTILQTYAPDEMRGRMQGVFIAVVAGGPRLGDVRAGATAAVTSTTFSWVGGGIACIVVVADRRRPRPSVLALRRPRATPAGGRAALASAVMALSGRQFRIRAGAQEATIVDVGAGLRSYTVDGVDVTCSYPKDEMPPKCCGTTLVPWPNRIRGGRYSFDGVAYQLALTEPATGNAIHGLGRWARWTEMNASPDRVTLRLDVVPQNGYPFEVRATITYRLHADRGLTVTFTARNRGTAPAPFGAGAHPYLSTRGHDLDEVTVQLPARTVLELDDVQIPVGSQQVAKTAFDLRRGRRLHDLRLDHGFTDLTATDGRGHAEVRTRDGGARLWFDDVYEYLQVFTKADVTPGQHGVAVEPMSCAPDAFNSGAGLIVLEPGAKWRGQWGITPI